MATLPKIKACPKCQTDDRMAIYTYESGWRYVECDGCWYRGPGAGSQRQAVKLHNEHVSALPAPPSGGQYAG